ncbi:hypothetical protein ACWEN6_33280, partial [Sphaerisporangium sp. NPDC004334]
MRLRIDPDRNIQTGTCDCCQTPFERITGFIKTTTAPTRSTTHRATTTTVSMKHGSTSSSTTP